MRLLGIDIGGTFIKYALISENKVVDSGKKPSNAKLGAEKLLETLFAVIDEFVCGFDGIAVSTAGIVGKNGEIVYANDNIPRYTGVKLKEILKNKYGVEVSVMNDAAAMAYSLKTELNDYFFIAVGTGVAGGYVSGPVVQAAARRGIRTAIHEQNAFPGVTNKILAKQVDLVFAAMPDAVQRLGAPDKTVVTGNPVREEMFRQDRPAARRALGAKEGQAVIISFGGSLGA